VAIVVLSHGPKWLPVIVTMSSVGGGGHHVLLHCEMWYCQYVCVWVYNISR